MPSILRFASLAALTALASSSADAKEPSPWLTFDTPTPTHVVINWETEERTIGRVEYRHGKGEVTKATSNAATARHQVQVPFPSDVPLSYRIGDGRWHSVQPLPRVNLRAAIIGDWGYAMDKNLDAIRSDAPHLLFTVGDNVPSLHEKGFEGTRAFSRMISLAPDLLATTPFMPILGNHDREVTPRGPKPPDHAVYDIDASAYREFFALPGDEWRWVFEIPTFDLRFIALDLNHVSDFGTTWQTCHDHRADAEPLAWFTATLDQSPQKRVITLMNEKRTSLKGTSGTGNSWLTQFLRTSAVVTGYGYFGEVATLSGKTPYFNTCLQGSSDKYLDPESTFVTTDDTYVLLNATSTSGPVRMELKNLSGKILHTIEIPSRTTQK